MEGPLLYVVEQLQGLTERSEHKRKEGIRFASVADALIGLLSRDRHDPGCLAFQTRRQTMHMKVHSELGCAPIWAFQELTAVDAAKVLPDTLWLLLLLLERRSTKAGLHDRWRMHVLKHVRL